jgi:ABC-2 type transport system permease protein
MRKIAELLKIYFLDKIRRPVMVAMTLLWGVAFFIFLFFVFEFGGLNFGSGNFDKMFIASYLVFIPAYVGIFGVSQALIQDKEKGLLKAYRSSRLSRAEYFGAKILAATISGLAISLLIAGISFVLSPININFGLLIALAALTVASHAGISLLLTSKIGGSEEHMMVFQLVMILLIAGTPIFYPQSIVPEPLQMIQQLFPLTHSVEMARSMATETVTFQVAAQKLGILSAFSAVLIGAAYRLYPF